MAKRPMKAKKKPAKKKKKVAPKIKRKKAAAPKRKKVAAKPKRKVPAKPKPKPKAQPVKQPGLMTATLLPTQMPPPPPAEAFNDPTEEVAERDIVGVIEEHGALDQLNEHEPNGSRPPS